MKQLLISLLFSLSPLLINANTPTPAPKITSIETLHQALAKQSCVDIINAYLMRIKTYNLSLNRGAPINAFVSLNPTVLLDAKALDTFKATTGKFKGPLHCVPVVIKDNIDSIDTPSTSGSLALLGSQPNHDAFLVRQIKHAGGLIIGKGAMDELASGMKGISSKSGRVGNAFDPNRNPGGSSGGVAAAVSADFALLGIGTDNSGSVRIPAVFNRIVGLRPSEGLISQTGIFPRGNTDGVAGPIAKDYQDLAILLGVIAKYPDTDDPKTAISKKRLYDYTSFMNTLSLKGKRIGVIHSVKDYKPFDTQDKKTKQLYQNTLERFKQAGATLIPIELPYFDSNRDANMAGEIEEINHYLAGFPSTRRNFKDICLSHRTYVLGNIKKCLSHIHEVSSSKSQTFKDVFKRFKTNRDYVEHLMTLNYIDALLMPISLSMGPTYDTGLITSSRAPVASNAGLPAITLLSADNGETNPLNFASFELIGRQFEEGKLIQLASAFEAQNPITIQPQLGKPDSTVFKTYTIPAYNTLLTLIGYEAFHHFLEHAKEQKIQPKPFEGLVRKILRQKEAKHIS